MPFSSDYYLRLYIEHNVLTGYELFLNKFNDYILECRYDHDDHVVNTALMYTMKRIIKNDWKDQYNEEITNKYTYLKTSIDSNIHRIERDGERNEELEGAESNDEFVAIFFKHLFHRD